MLLGVENVHHKEPCFVLDPAGERLQNRHPDRISVIKNFVFRGVICDYQNERSERYLEKYNACFEEFGRVCEEWSEKHEAHMKISSW